MTKIDLAIKDIDHAFSQLEFAIRIMCYCELNHLDKEKFDNDILIELPNENMHFQNGSFKNQESIVIASQMLVGTAFGVSAIILDAGYDAANIKKNIKSRDSYSDLRVLVYMVRCAFAHNMADPKWDARGIDFARQFNLNLDHSTQIDLTNLNGHSFEYEHIGGFTQWFKIKDAVVRSLNGI